jgi:UDP-N-acetylmuramoylalanine--D-glutamate ligase
VKIAILGYGSQGQSVYEYYKNTDNALTVCDKDTATNLPEGVDSQIGEAYLDGLDRFDLIFRGPGVHPTEIVKANGKAILGKVTSNTNEFLRLCPTKNVVGVTGTKGKGTTSTLIAKMLEESGLRVHLGGNIGTPPLDLLAEDIKEEDWVVLELANYQLIDLKYPTHIAVCLMVEPEHLDWHADENEYYEAKAKLFECQTKDDLAIYYGLNANSKRIASASPGKLIPYFESPGALVDGSNIVVDGTPVIRTSEIKLIGKHNLQNVCAAVTAVWQINQDTEPMADVLREFSGLPFRLEIIREVKGVKYVDDSFASAPPASVAAIEAVKGPKILILGGKDRGLDLKDLVKAVSGNAKDIKKIFIIGNSSERLAKALSGVNFTDYEVLGSSKSMKEIVDMASKIASAEDSVILSPGFPSFDMFKNFEDRGLKFNDAVDNL